jgi:hypothetical protein
MKLPRVSIGGLMFGMAMACLPLAIVINFLNNHSFLPWACGDDIGIWPTLTIFGITTRYLLRNWRANSSFLVGFTWSGWASVLAFVGCCFWTPQIVLSYMTFFIDESDWMWMVLSIHWNWTFRDVGRLLIYGLILAIPQFMIATLGGLMTRWIWGKRWTTTSS